MNSMAVDQSIRSPAKRARRCMICLLVCMVTVLGAYRALRADRPLPEKKPPIVTAYDVTIGHSGHNSTVVAVGPSAN